MAIFTPIVSHSQTGRGAREAEEYVLPVCVGVGVGVGVCVCCLCTSVCVFVYFAVWWLCVCLCLCVGACAFLTCACVCVCVGICVGVLVYVSVCVFCVFLCACVVACACLRVCFFGGGRHLRKSQLWSAKWHAESDKYSGWAELALKLVPCFQQACFMPQTHGLLVPDSCSDCPRINCANC